MKITKKNYLSWHRAEISFKEIRDPQSLDLEYIIQDISHIVLKSPLCIEFIGVTLVNKIIQVSDAQFYNTSAVHCIVCSPPEVMSLSITTDPPIPSSAYPHPHPGYYYYHTMVHVPEFSFSFLLNSLSLPSCLTTTAVSLLSMSLSLFSLLVYFVH